MNDLDLRQEPLPDDMRVLLKSYPRDTWDAHPNFKDATRNWLGAHQMFRRLGEFIRVDTERYLDQSRDGHDYAAHLSHYGNALVNNLHGHHNWEDHSYFPELSAADPRFDSAIEILEKDHLVLDQILHDFTSTANRTIKLMQLDEKAAFEEAGKVHKTAQTIEALLHRHLTDEEEVVVPIIIHHKLRG